MIYREGGKGSKIPNIIDMISTGIKRSSRLANKPKQKCVLFAKFSLAVIGSCGLAKNHQIQHIQETNRNFYGTLNHFVPIIFV